LGMSNRNLETVLDEFEKRL
jgi:alkyl hydroperoxide reductase subunit AhpF